MTMGTAERRMELLKTLCKRKFDTVSNLAFEFGVSERTIRRDIQVLSLKEPIYTQTGRYNGGVYILNSYSTNRTYFSDEESGVMLRVLDILVNHKQIDLSDEDLIIVKRIVTSYTKPTNERMYNEKRRKRTI